MSSFAEDEPHDGPLGEPIIASEGELLRPEPSRTEFGAPQTSAPAFVLAPQHHLVDDAPFAPVPAEESPQIFSPMLPEVPRQVRIPHLGHLLMLLLILLCGFSATIGVILLAVHNHLYGVTSIQGTATEIHYTLGSEALIYIFTLIGSFIVFPLFWKKSLFSGLQWNAGTALRLRWRLVAAAFICFLLALLNSEVFPEPKNTPIEQVFRQPGAAWLLFFFGITFAPFFEEMFFRGFLLPALCTACDWTNEVVLSRRGPAFDAASGNGPSVESIILMVIVAGATVGAPIEMFRALSLQQWGAFLLCIPVIPTIYLLLFILRRPTADRFILPPAKNGHPRWSAAAMVVGSVATSLPFAGLHAAQTGYSLGPFLLLVCVSLVLCTVRLWTRSLAASTLVHASYNFMLFAIMLIGTHGFRHMDKL